MKNNNQKGDLFNVPSSTKSVNKISMVEVKSQGMIHDVCYDSTGTKIAIGTSDGHIEIQEFSLNSFKSEQKDIVISTILDFQHKGPVWQLGWSHPKYGNILASCSFDKTIALFREEKQGKYLKYLVFSENKESVQSIAWSYKKLILAAAVADGSVHIYYRKKGEKGEKESEWEHKQQNAHENSVQQVSWIRDKELQFASCSIDCSIIIWYVNKHVDGEFNLLNKLTIQCNSWVRSIDWAAEPIKNSILLLAAGLESGEVHIFYINNETYELVNEKEIIRKGPCWKVQWSPLGNQLAISTLNDKNDPFVAVYRQTQTGNFEEI